MASSKGESSCERDSTETEPLLRNSRSVWSRKKKRHPCRFSYRLIKIPGKGAVFMILYNVFFSTTLLEWNENAHKHSIEHSKLLVIPMSVSLLFFLSIGLVSETCLGRYKFLTASLYLWLTAIVFMALNVIVSSVTLYLLHLVAVALSTACHLSCVIPFTIEQLVGASGEELSFTIYWITWAWWTFSSISGIIQCHLPVSYQLDQTVALSIYSLSFISAYFMILCCGHVLMTKP